MADGIKKYQIVINGLTESISQVERLNGTLKTLEERINALSSKKVDVAASTSSGGDSNLHQRLQVCLKRKSFSVR